MAWCNVGRISSSHVLAKTAPSSSPTKKAFLYWRFNYWGKVCQGPQPSSGYQNYNGPMTWWNCCQSKRIAKHKWLSPEITAHGGLGLWNIFNQSTKLGQTLCVLPAWSEGEIELWRPLLIRQARYWFLFSPAQLFLCQMLLSHSEMLDEGAHADSLVNQLVDLPR